MTRSPDSGTPGPVDVRGCLFTLLLGVVLLGGACWFGAPPLAAAFVRLSLESAGLASTEPLEVELGLDTPLDLLSGRADRVTVRARGARVAGIAADRATIELGGVDLFGAHATTIELEMVRPTLSAGPDSPRLEAERLTARGSIDSADAAVTITAEQFLAVSLEPFRAAFGGAPSAVSFTAPARLTASIGGSSVSATLRIEDGALVVDPDPPAVPTIDVFRAGEDIPFEPTTVEVVDGALVLGGRLDLSAWLG
jgi:hypothetical protein